MKTHHPYVSENHEGSPWFEWVIAVLVIASAIIALLGYTMAATVVLSVTAIACGVIRLTMKNHSPWKIRSVYVDACCGIGFGVILLLLYLSILLLNH